ncbi:outer arm dynein light chain 1, partial [Dacryopinax primogenitus]
MANTEQGDDYIRRFAAFIRSHEQSLASAGFVPRTRHHSTSQSEPYNLLSWVTPSQPQRHTSPVVLSIDPHHLSYILMRMEALGLNVGDMDVKLETPLKQNAYMSLLAAKDRDAQSIFSIRSTLSAVSKLSLGPSLGWLMGGAVQPPSLDTELKHMYSLMTLLPALSLHAFSARMITELAEDPPVDNALPLDVFKSLQSLEMTDVDPRDYIGWDQLSIGLRSFTIRRSSVEDVSDVLVDAVANDMVRRKGDLKTPVKNRPRLIHHASSIRSQHPSISPDGLPHSPPAEAPPPTLPAYTWASLRHLALPDNALTFFPSAPTPYLSALQSLDLSSNLLVSLPPCLSQIPTLTHLSVAHNMLDSILGIGALLPEVRSLNLSHNRLDSLCGLERLPRLRFADLRSNALEDSAEVGRLSQCMEIEDVWIEDNMFCRTEPDWRVRVFELFRREGREV